MFVAGDPMGHFYKVTKGIVLVFRSLDDGRRQIVGLHAIGDLCGYLEKDRSYNFSGEALTDVEACSFDRRRNRLGHGERRRGHCAEPRHGGGGRVVPHG